MNNVKFLQAGISLVFFVLAVVLANIWFGPGMAFIVFLVGSSASMNTAASKL